MSMGMSMSMGMRQEQRQTMRMSLEQRAAYDDHIHGLVISLSGAVRDERYEPVGQCPICFTKMKPAEILRGFTDDPKDFTTKCPNGKCQRRFAPRLICFGLGSQIELPYYCPCQVLGPLRSVSGRQPADIARELPGEYRSAIIHHGTLHNAFKQIGVDYSFPEISGWEPKAQPFLGKLPDTVIARCCGVSPAVIRRRRHAAELPTFNKWKALREAERSSATAN